MALADPWQAGAEPGVKRAVVVKPERVVDEIKQSKRPLLVAGSRVIEKEHDGTDLVGYIVKLAEILEAPIVVSPGVIPHFNVYKYPKIVNLGAVDLVDKLMDQDWRGFDGGGNYDLVIFLGGLYYFQNLILSSLKSLSRQKTIAMDRFYHPNATYSFQNLPGKMWGEYLDFILENLKRG